MSGENTRIYDISANITGLTDYVRRYLAVQNLQARSRLKITKMACTYDGNIKIQPYNLTSSSAMSR